MEYDHESRTRQYLSQNLPDRLLPQKPPTLIEKLAAIFQPKKKPEPEMIVEYGKGLEQPCPCCRRKD